MIIRNTFGAENNINIIVLIRMCAPLFVFLISKQLSLMLLVIILLQTYRSLPETLLKVREVLLTPYNAKY